MLLSIERIAKPLANLPAQLAVVGLINYGRSELALRLSRFLTQLLDACAYLLNFLVGKLDGIHYGLFLDLAGAGFDHHNSFSRAHDHDAQQAAHFFVSGIDDELATYQTNPNCPHRTPEGNVRKG